MTINFHKHFNARDCKASKVAKHPFYMRFCNGVDENFQHHFDVNIGYYFTEACITNSITV